MNKLVIFAFGVLGVVFYQMSGGADFKPQEPLVVAEIVEEVIEPIAIEAPIVQRDRTVRPSSLPQLDVAEGDTAPTIKPRTVRATLRAATEAQALEASQPPKPLEGSTDADWFAALAAIQAGQPLTVAVVDTDAAPEEETEEVLPSLILNTRQITGDRVNMRAGPSTDFGIVDRLVRGDTMEVLQDPGNGWLELRAIESGVEGWVADFLLSSG